MSIFSKECPQCAATRPADASRCGCGYVFDPYLLDDAQRTLGLAAEEEKLYEEYLAARAAQAVEAARVAAKLTAIDPENEPTVIDDAGAQRGAQAANAELAAQRARAAQAAEAAKIEAAEQGAKSWRTKLAAQATKAVKGVAPTATRQQVRLAVKPIRAAPGAVGTAKAARIRKAEAAPPVTGRHLTPSNKPGATFKAAQAAKVVKALRVTLARETVECPWCTATVAASAVRCRCGYSFATGVRAMPPLALSAGERAALAEGSATKKLANKPRR